MVTEQELDLEVQRLIAADVHEADMSKRLVVVRSFKPISVAALFQFVTENGQPCVKAESGRRRCTKCSIESIKGFLSTITPQRFEGLVLVCPDGHISEVIFSMN
ncbi:MAG: hypothetical protein A2666_02035 [Parcubacteria group bacterium RIFCSPHIGHO2_01_FULL_47_10b]|nr:MAG: hypothetical protein A2666_02035 [Parcubacteria group bacterium RIFCSPHIGHO2_01_FULL_47_10b]